MNITVTLNVNAPELAEAITVLASAIAIGKNSLNPALDYQEKAVFVPAPTVTIPEAPATLTTQAPITPVTQIAPVTPVAPIQPPIAPVAPAPVIPTATQTYTMEQLAVAATQIVDAGRRQELVNLLSSFGVQALTALPKEQYGAFATQLRTMGAKI